MDPDGRDGCCVFLVAWKVFTKKKRRLQKTSAQQNLRFLTPEIIPNTLEPFIFYLT